MKKKVKKPSKFKCNKVSVLIILVFIPLPPILRCCSVVVSSKEKNKIKQNPQNKKTPQSVPSSNAIQFQ
jgi:hypothetical protein